MNFTDEETKIYGRNKVWGGGRSEKEMGNGVRNLVSSLQKPVYRDKASRLRLRKQRFSDLGMEV